MNSMTLVHNRCRFVDKQIVKLQETPYKIPEGGTPNTVSILMHDKLVDSGKPGDRVEITGIYRAISIRVGPIQRTVKSIFKTYIDCLHLKKTDKSKLHIEDPMECDSNTSNNRTVEDETPNYQDKVEKLKELSKLPDIYDRLTRSLAPNIWELDEMSKGVFFARSYTALRRPRRATAGPPMASSPLSLPSSLFHFLSLSLVRRFNLEGGTVPVCHQHRSPVSVSQTRDMGVKYLGQESDMGTI